MIWIQILMITRILFVKNNKELSVKYPVSDQTSRETNRTTPIQLSNSFSKTTYIITRNRDIVTTRLVIMLLHLHAVSCASSWASGTVTILSRMSTCFCLSRNRDRIFVLPLVHDDHPLLRHTIFLQQYRVHNLLLDVFGIENCCTRGRLQRGYFTSA